MRIRDIATVFTLLAMLAGAVTTAAYIEGKEETRQYVAVIAGVK